MKKVIIIICVFACTGCGVKLGSNMVLGTTSFLEEVNRGQSAGYLRERINTNDRMRLQAKLDEVK